MKKHGWIAMLLALTLLIGGTSMARAEIIPSPGEGQIGLSAVVVCESLNVHQEPSASSANVKTLHFGDVIIIQSQGDGWAACYLSDDVDGSLAGWVSEDSLAIDPSWFRPEKQTPVYAWDDVKAPRLTLIDENTMVPILKDEGSWIVVSLQGAVGWIDCADKTGRQNGERYETTIMLEGMEETVRYEHIVSNGLGIEMDYDYELFLRRSEGDRECFVLAYDDQQAPLNYFELTFRAQDAAAAADAISESLSGAYDITRETCTLKNAGDCTVIRVSSVKGKDIMPELMQTVYVIPAASGCIVAHGHCTIESVEGFEVRFGHMMDTLSFIGPQAQ